MLSDLRTASIILVMATCAPSALAKTGADSKHHVTAGHATLPLVVMHKDPNCMCCTSWAKHLERAGFKVDVRKENGMAQIKQRLGVPAGKTSCHTAEVAGYIIEGHVPVADILRLLREKPDARGLTVAGMPAGSPGMEVPGGHVDAYTVELIARDGTTRVYSRHGQ